MNLEGTHWITSVLAKMSFSTKDTDIQRELQSSLLAFNKPLEENGVVLVISLGIPTIECPGMLPEEKVGLSAKNPHIEVLLKNILPKTRELQHILQEACFWLCYTLLRRNAGGFNKFCSRLLRY